MTATPSTHLSSLKLFLHDGGEAESDSETLKITSLSPVSGNRDSILTPYLNLSVMGLSPRSESFFVVSEEYGCRADC